MIGWEGLAPPCQIHLWVAEFPGRCPSLMGLSPSGCNCSGAYWDWQIGPARGVFSLQLSGAAGRPFVLMSSTNLMGWTPILTNVGAAPTFQFRGTNAASYSCRSFKIVPVGAARGEQ